jgi:hypothetical protein
MNVNFDKIPISHYVKIREAVVARDTEALEVFRNTYAVYEVCCTPKLLKGIFEVYLQENYKEHEQWKAEAYR